MAEAHHYLSQAYLSGFTNDLGEVCMLDRHTGRLSRCHPKVLAFQNDLYAFKDKNCKINRTFERDFFGLVDRPLRRLVERVRTREPLTDEELIHVALFAACLRVRTPTGIRELDEVARAYAKRMNPLQSKEYVEERLRTQERESGEAISTTADDIVEMFASGRYQIAPDRGHLLSEMCKMGAILGSILQSLDWTFLIAPRSRQFIISDCPFVVVPPRGHDSDASGVGVRSPGAVKYVPLSSDLCLKAGEPGPAVTYRQVDSAEVRQINYWVAQNSERFVFASSEELLQRIAEGARLKSGRDKSEIIVREIPQATDERRALFHVYSRPKIEFSKSGSASAGSDRQQIKVRPV